MDIQQFNKVFADLAFRTEQIRGEFPVSLGVSVSIQASDIHDCAPRRQYGPYTHVEIYVGDHPYLEGYLKESGYVNGSIAGMVPVNLVVEALNAYARHLNKSAW